MIDGLLQLGILHMLVQVIFLGLIACMFIQMILSWLTMAFLPPDAPIIRFFNRITSPMIDPIRRRLPSMSVGMMDLSWSVAFIFVFWGLLILNALISATLPANW
jgi:uncharacterized protein YggT (Ycf19 family)